MAAVIVTWLVIGPLGVGGRISYIIVTGNSMYPRLHKGDLVVVRRQPAYGAGQIVTYRHPDIGSVIHRVMDVQPDGRLTVRGDHNTWTDSYYPRSADVIGSYWFKIPGAGNYVSALRDPQILAVVAGVVGIIMVTGAVSNPTRSRRQRQRHSAARQRPAASSPAVTLLDERGRETGALLAVVGVLALAVVVLAWLRPVTHQVATAAAYRQSGSFSYTAAAGADVYDGGVVAAGQPVFRQLTDRVNVTYDYQLKGDAADVTGTYRLIAAISDSSGWQRTIELTPTTPFSGASVTIAGTLDLNHLQVLVDTMQRATGITQNSYSVAVVPEVAVNGTLAGAPLADSFAPRLLFQLDPLRLTLVSGSDTTQTAQLQPAKDGSVKVTRELPNTIGALGYGIAVEKARMLALAVLAVCAAGLLWLALQTLRVLRSDEARKIRAKHGELLVTVRRSDAISGHAMVELANFDDLRRVALTHGQTIMHDPCGERDDFYVREDGAVYYYRASPSQPPSTALSASLTPPSGAAFEETGPLPIVRRAPDPSTRDLRPVVAVAAVVGVAVAGASRMRRHEC